MRSTNQHLLTYILLEKYIRYSVTFDTPKKGKQDGIFPQPVVLPGTKLAAVAGFK